MHISSNAWRACTRWRSNRRSGPGWPACLAGPAFLVGLLAEHAEDLGEPYTRHLSGKVRELRFHLLRQQTRVTYWLAPHRRVILLTVFRKTRSAEVTEVARARRAQEICESTHGIAHEVFDREVT